MEFCYLAMNHLSVARSINQTSQGQGKKKHSTAYVGSKMVEQSATTTNSGFQIRGAFLSEEA